MPRTRSTIQDGRKCWQNVYQPCRWTCRHSSKSPTSIWRAPKPEPEPRRARWIPRWSASTSTWWITTAPGRKPAEQPERRDRETCEKVLAKSHSQVGRMLCCHVMCEICHIILDICPTYFVSSDVYLLKYTPLW